MLRKRHAVEPVPGSWRLHGGIGVPWKAWCNRVGSTDLGGYHVKLDSYMSSSAYVQRVHVGCRVEFEIWVNDLRLKPYKPILDLGPGSSDNQIVTVQELWGSGLFSIMPVMHCCKRFPRRGDESCAGRRLGRQTNLMPKESLCTKCL